MHKEDERLDAWLIINEKELSLLSTLFVSKLLFGTLSSYASYELHQMEEEDVSFILYVSSINYNCDKVTIKHR